MDVVVHDHKIDHVAVMLAPHLFKGLNEQVFGYWRLEYLLLVVCPGRNVIDRAWLDGSECSHT